MPTPPNLGDAMRHAAQTLERGVVIVEGAFRYDGSNVIILTGTGFTVVRTAAGKFTVTFTHKFAEQPVKVCSYSEDGDAVDIYAQGGAFVLANRTWVIKTKTAGANTDPGTGADDQVEFAVFARTTTVQ